MAKKNKEKFNATTLFWNLPVKKQNITGFYRLKNVVADKPCMINTRQGEFVYPPQLETKQVNTDKLIKRLNKTGLNVYLYEPLCFYHLEKPTYTVGHYEEFHSEQNLKIKSYEIDDIIREFSKRGLHNYTIYTCDYDTYNIWADSYPNIDIRYYDIYMVSLYNSRETKTNIIEKKFLCTNARYSPHRHLVMNKLVDKEGFYSWPFEVNPSALDHIHWVKERFNVAEKTGILNNERLFLDINTKEKVDKVEDFVCADVEGNHHVIEPYYNKVFCKIVTETRYAQPFANYSEKTTRAIQNLLPFVIVAPPRTLELLKSQGYKTFDKWWDESYDLNENHGKRMAEIFKVIDYIDSFTYDDLLNIYEEMLPTLQHNINILSTQ